MKKLMILCCLFIATASHADNGLVKLKSNLTVEQTTQHLIAILKGKGMTVFKTINHQQGASQVNIELLPTTVVIFGNPKIGSLLMKCGQTIAIDLPQKALIWQDKNKQTWLAYNNPRYLAKRHALTGCKTELKKITSALAKFAQLAVK